MTIKPEVQLVPLYPDQAAYFARLLLLTTYTYFVGAGIIASLYAEGYITNYYVMIGCQIVLAVVLGSIDAWYCTYVAPKRLQLQR